MALKWVRCLKPINRMDDKGKKHAYYKGDWFQARNMEIRKRLAAGEIELATSLGQTRVYRVEDCGVITSDSKVVESHLGLHGKGLDITYSSDFILKYPYNLCWNGGKLRTELLPISFELLKKWEIAIPIGNFDILAEHIGSEQDRVLTKSVLGDLRVPLYDVQQIYARRCPAVKKLFKDWDLEKAKITGGDPRLSFIRALYVNPLLILALPPSWITGIHE